MRQAYVAEANRTGRTRTDKEGFVRVWAHAVWTVCEEPDTKGRESPIRVTTRRGVAASRRRAGKRGLPRAALLELGLLDSWRYSSCGGTRASGTGRANARAEVTASRRPRPPPR